MKTARRDKEVAARQTAMRVARIMLAENLSQPEAATHYGSNRESLSHAALILQSGTPEEIASVETGEAALAHVSNAIRKRLSPEARFMKPPVRGRYHIANREIDAEMWNKMKTAFEAIGSMPRPVDMVAIVRRNINRTDHVNRRLLDTLAWIEEFSNAWTE